jgi:hypothetical protein
MQNTKPQWVVASVVGVKLGYFGDSRTVLREMFGYVRGECNEKTANVS